MTSSTQPPASPSSIPLYLINGVATVWDAQIAATLHCEHGISGLRVGTLPGVSQQNAFLGLPMTLMKEETAYLVTQGIAHLVPVRRELALPDARTLEEYNDARVARIRAQELRNRQAAEKKAIVGKEAFQKGGDAARAKREARAKAKAERERAQREAEGTLFGEEVPQQSIPVTATPQTETTPIEGSGGHFHTVQAMPTFPELSFAESITNLPHPLFPFPNTPRDQALLTTFKTLADNGLRMGLGPRFGGEYLVYPGDYLRYHAHFTSQVLVRDECLKPTEIVAWGRLGTGTKKAGLICCWDDGKGEIEGEAADMGEVDFYSLEWANFG